MGTVIPADGPHQHRDSRKEALFQDLILCRSGPRAKIRLRTQELVGESKKRGQGHHLQAHLSQGERDMAGSRWVGFSLGRGTCSWFKHGNSVSPVKT